MSVPLLVWQKKEKSQYHSSLLWGEVVHLSSSLIFLYLLQDLGFVFDTLETSPCKSLLSWVLQVHCQVSHTLSHKQNNLSFFSLEIQGRSSPYFFFRKHLICQYTFQTLEFRAKCSQDLVHQYYFYW